MNRFIKAFEEKPDKDLQTILENPNHHTFQAIEAAEIILYKRKNQNKVIEKRKIQLQRKKKDKKSKYNLKRDFQLFWNNYSWRVALGHIATSMAFGSLILVFDFYAGEDSLIIPRLWTVTPSAIVLLILNHRLYKNETKHTLTLYIRCFNGIFFVFYFLLIQTINNSFLYRTNAFLEISFDTFLGIVIVFPVIIWVFELIIETILLAFDKIRGHNA